MMSLLYYLGLLAIITLAHELGHYIAYKVYKLKPKLRFNKLAIILEDDNMMLKSVAVNLNIYLWGIIAGYLMMGLLLWQGAITQEEYAFWFVAYIILSGFDFINIGTILQYKKSYTEPCYLVYGRAIAKLQRKIRNTLLRAGVLPQGDYYNAECEEQSSLKPSRLLNKRKDKQQSD